MTTTDATETNGADPPAVTVPDLELGNGSGLDDRLIDHVLARLLGATPAVVFAQFPADPVTPSRQNAAAKARAEALDRFKDQVLGPALSSTDHAVNVAALVVQLFDHLNSGVTVDVDAGLWRSTLTDWHDQATVRTGAVDESGEFLARLFTAYTNVEDDGALFGPEFDTYVEHRDNNPEVGY